MINEFNCLTTMPLQWLCGLIILFILTICNLSVQNLIIFLLIYVVITRIHMNMYGFNIFNEK